MGATRPEWRRATPPQRQSRTPAKPTATPTHPTPPRPATLAARFCGFWAAHNPRFSPGQHRGVRWGAAKCVGVQRVRR